MMISLKQRGLGLYCCVAVLLASGALNAQSIAIHPGYTIVGVNQTVQYTAAVTGLTNQTVTWSVSGVKGGNSIYGEITTGGLYTAPATIPANGITVSALGSDGKTFAIVYVAVEPAGPSISSKGPSIFSYLRSWIWSRCTDGRSACGLNSFQATCCR